MPPAEKFTNYKSHSLWTEGVITCLSFVQKCLQSLLSALHAFFAFIDVSSNVIEWHTSPATLCKSRNTEFGDVSACNRFLLILHQFIVHIQNQFHFVRLAGGSIRPPGCKIVYCKPDRHKYRSALRFQIKISPCPSPFLSFPIRFKKLFLSNPPMDYTKTTWVDTRHGSF